MKLALAQISASLDRQANIAKAIDYVDRAGSSGADLVVFPELAVDRFFPQHPEARETLPAESIPGPTADRVAEAARRNGIVVVFNMYELAEDGRRYDSSPVFEADGSLVGVTRMVHIAEYACFHEQAYYDPGDRGAPVFDTSVGRLGVAICYDRHYPEYMRALGKKGADLVVVPQAGSLGEWPPGVFEAELQAAAFQNGYFTALCNRTGTEERLEFPGESFVVSPKGEVIARAPASREHLLMIEVDLRECSESPARTLFWRDRRPGLYGDWF